MPTHSLDLRQRIVAAYQAGGTSIREVAKRFMVTKRTVHRLVQQYKQTQDLTPKKVGTLGCAVPGGIASWNFRTKLS
jgi:Transposase and inactivated derivatives